MKMARGMAKTNRTIRRLRLFGVTSNDSLSVTAAPIQGLIAPRRWRKLLLIQISYD
jgi:hypothetical protein